jgi:EamA domain-containing membrane protein RarD
MSAHEDDHASTAPFVAAFLALILFGLAVRYWVWVAAGAGVLVLGAVLLWLAFYAARRVDKRHEAQAAFVARADQQHAWVLAGDDRGIYGDYRPEVYPSGRG